MLVRRTLVPADIKPVTLEGAGEPGQTEGHGRVASSLVPRILTFPADRPSTQGPLEVKGPPASMLIPRMLVPVDVKAALAEGPRHGTQIGTPGGASTASRRSGGAGARARPALFVQAMLENSPTKPKGRAKELVASFVVHGVVLATLLILPLYFTAAIDLQQFNRTLLVAPPAPAPPPPPPLVASVKQPFAPSKIVLLQAGKFTAPRVIPNQIVRSIKDDSAADLAAANLPGIAGGVPGGQAGGVLGGILSGSSPSALPPPPPTAPNPKTPLRVGGQVKEPRLLTRVEPVYPLLLRQAKVSGTVVVDAVIDTQGNVVQMRPLSGNALLIPPAMDALRRWKYAPTILGGQAYPVELTVTIEFRLG